MTVPATKSQPEALVKPPGQREAARRHAREMLKTA